MPILTTNADKANVALSKRSILSQALACSAQNLLLLDLGMAISFSTIVIPALLGAEGQLSFTEEEASWFGSVNFILQPIGSILSGFLLEPLGRKKAMLIVNIPHIVAWLMVYFAKNITTLFCATALLGFGTGFMEAPTLTYVGEISHPSVRGILISYSQVCTNLGILLSYILGAAVGWRTAAACFIVVPIITFIAILFVPESPIWLLSRGRIEDARKAVCWTRGWVKPDQVEEEFNDLIEYQRNSSKCDICKSDVPYSECPHKTATFGQKAVDYFKCMTRKEMTRPLLVMFLMFLFHQLTGLNAFKPNMVNIYNFCGIPMDGYKATVITGAIGLFGVIVLMLIVRIFGKRPLNLISLALSSVCLVLLGIYAYVVLPRDKTSYDKITENVGSNSWIPAVLFASLNLIGFLGISIIPWLMIAELYPLRGRGLACGITAAYVYILSSIISKLQLYLEQVLGFYGTMWFYAACSALGFFVMYFFMPETEGKPYAEIEEKFAGEKIPIFADDIVYRTLKRKLHKNRSKEKIITKM